MLSHDILDYVLEHFGRCDRDKGKRNDCYWAEDGCLRSWRGRGCQHWHPVAGDELAVLIAVHRGETTMTDETDIRHRCFMDGIDWQHHLSGDACGTELFPCEESLREKKTCITTGGCGVVEVEVRLIRWVEPQNLVYPPEPSEP
jgi:hypothetical protein